MKKSFFITGCIIAVLIGENCSTASAQDYRSKYIGQEYEKIKSLSSEDVKELLNGEGWGLAKAAELNGFPGPAHLLQMKEELELSQKQIGQIEQLYEEMRKEAIPLGAKLIELERELNKSFANRTIDEQRLKDLLGLIADIHEKLRHVHLSAHLKTPAILNSLQIDNYNKLRGYFSGEDPCKNIPPGHDPEIWKKHHNCE